MLDVSRMYHERRQRLEWTSKSHATERRERMAKVAQLRAELVAVDAHIDALAAQKAAAFSAADRALRGERRAVLRETAQQRDLAVRAQKHLAAQVEEVAKTMRWSTAAGFPEGKDALLQAEAVVHERRTSELQVLQTVTEEQRALDEQIARLRATSRSNEDRLRGCEELVVSKREAAMEAAAELAAAPGEAVRKEPRARLRKEATALATEAEARAAAAVGAANELLRVRGAREEREAELEAEIAKADAVIGEEEVRFAAVAAQARARGAEIDDEVREATARVDTCEAALAAVAQASTTPTSARRAPRVVAKSAARVEVPLVSDVARRALKAPFGSQQARRDFVGFYASIYPLLQASGVPILRRVHGDVSTVAPRCLGLTRDLTRLELWSDGDKLCNAFLRVDRLQRTVIPPATFAQIERVRKAPATERKHMAPLNFELLLNGADPEHLAVAAPDFEQFAILTDALTALCDAKTRISQYRVHIFAEP